MGRDLQCRGEWWTTIGICYHVSFYSGLGNFPHDVGMPKQPGCQWSVQRMPFHTSCRSSDVWMFILCLQRVAFTCPLLGSCALPNPASPTALVWLWGAITENGKPQYVPLLNSQKVTLDTLSSADLSSILNRRGAPVPSWSQNGSQRRE